MELATNNDFFIFLMDLIVIFNEKSPKEYLLGAIYIFLYARIRIFSL